MVSKAAIRVPLDRGGGGRRQRHTGRTAVAGFIGGRRPPPIEHPRADDRRDVQRILDERSADVDVTPQQWLESNPVLCVLDGPEPHKTPPRLAAPLNPEIRVGDSAAAAGWTATAARGAWSLDPPRQIPLPEPIHVAGRVVRARSCD